MYALDAIAEATHFVRERAIMWNEQEESGLATLPLADIPGIDHTTNRSMWKRDPRSPLIKSGAPGSCDSAMASDPKVFYDSDQEVPLYCCT
jgi:hypothetical protein